MQINVKNEKVKRRYRSFLKEADRKSDQTVRQIDRAIARYETFTNYADLATFDQRNAVRFKNSLTDRDLAKATIHSTVTALKRFFGWLALEPGYKSRIKKNDIEYLNISDKDVRAAKAPADRPFPSLEQVQKALAAMPADSPVEKRNRAVVAMLALTGIRDGALITLKVRHLDVERQKVLQNPNEVATKNSKRIDTFLHSFMPESKIILFEWKDYLVENEMFGPTDPLFPATKREYDKDRGFVATNLTRDHWSSAQSVREILRECFEAVGCPYYPPHSFRNMLTQQGYKYCKTPVQMKAWSQNFGHESILTTMMSYGSLDLTRQSEIIGQLGLDTDEDRPATIRDIQELLKRNGKS